jgi:hypothetical protein
MQQIKGAKADLYYGATGCHKTSNIGKAAVWAMKKYGKVTRLVSADGGGWEPIQGLVDAGIVVPWMIRDRENQIEALDLACQGYWPAEPADPSSRLISPYSVQYTGTCVNGHTLPSKGIPQKSQYPCPECQKTNVNALLTVTSHRAPSPDNDLSQVAIVAFEGLTSFGDLMLVHLANKRASLSQDPSYQWQDGSTTYSGGNMTYYGFVQNRLYDFVMKTNSLPVEKVIWTAGEGRGEDEQTKTPVYGPSIAGRKATGKAGHWFGAMLHFEAVEKLGQVEADQQTRTGVVSVSTEYRMYLRNHADALTKIMFPAKTRVPYQYAKALPDFMTTDVEALYVKTDELHARSASEMDAIKAGVLTNPTPSKE